MTTDIFSSGSDQSQTPNEKAAQANGDNLGESVAILVGEGRKYKTIEELAKAYVHIDGFAETLKSENATLREQLAKASTLDDVLERLKAPAPSQSDQTDGKSQSGLTVQDVAKIVSDTLTGMESQRTREGNLLKADTAMKQLFGEKAKEVFDKEASTPEMRKALMELATVSPEKFVAVFAPGRSSAASADNKTSVNTGALENFSASGRSADATCKEFYDEMRRKDPAKFYSHSVQLQMNKAAVANPSRFFNR
jgi:hypothetical protein